MTSSEVLAKLKFLSSTDLQQASIPIGVKHFLEGTSFHGFHEMYHAKNIFWKLVWFVVCVGSIAITSYQVNNAVMDYVGETTATIILPAQENSILYPPLSLCYWHWYYWMDWKKAMNIVKNKETLFYAASFYNTIYTNEFDVEKAREEFVNVLHANNLTTVSDFYLAVARDVPIFADNNIKPFFDTKKIVYNVDYNMFCYQVSAANMKKFFVLNQNNDGTVRPKIITFNTYDETYDNFTRFVTEQEHNYYVLRWASKHSMYTMNDENPNSGSSLTKFIPPKLLLVSGDIDRSVEVQVENDAYQFDVQASVYTWQNKLSKVCAEDKQAVASDTECQKLCRSYYELNACSCQNLEVAYLIKHDKIDKVCQKGFIFYSEIKVESLLLNLTTQTQMCSETPTFLSSYYKCLNNCIPACQIWNYEKTLTVRTSSKVLRAVGTKSSTTIRLDYPMGKDIVIMTETDAQSWENFIGNVGGLLGIWTGASLVSFVQLVYLCCCADHEEDCASFSKCAMRMRPKKTTKVTRIITIKSKTVTN